MRLLKNILLVSGSGRNCGKTTVACKIIRKFRGSGKIIAVKITPHFHLTGNKQHFVAACDGFVLYKEYDSESGKDTARMLLAGAEAVYFLQCEDHNLENAFTYLEKLIPEDVPVVCESGSLAYVYKSALHLLVTDANADQSKRSYMMNKEIADVILTKGELSFNMLIDQIEFSNKSWTINKVNNDQVRRSA